jgi:uncharacterized Zn-finger protein
MNISDLLIAVQNDWETRKEVEEPFTLSSCCLKEFPQAYNNNNNNNNIKAEITHYHSREQDMHHFPSPDSLKEANTIYIPLLKASSSATAKSPQQRFRCTETGCDKSFTRRYNLSAHLRCHRSEKPFACPHEGCILAFARKHDLSRY